MLSILTLAFAFAKPAPPATTSPPAPASEAAPAPPTAEGATTPVPEPRPPRFAQTSVVGCGCSFYAPRELTIASTGESPDGSDVWMGEAVIDGWRYGAIGVKFAESLKGTTPEEREELLISYLEFLRGQLGVVSSAGVGRGHTHAVNADARGVIDYWRDAKGDDYAVKGWVDELHLGVAYIAGKGSYPWLPAQQLYLDGFRFW